MKKISNKKLYSTEKSELIVGFNNGDDHRELYLQDNGSFFLVTTKEVSKITPLRDEDVARKLLSESFGVTAHYSNGMPIPLKLILEKLITE